MSVSRLKDHINNQEALGETTVRAVSEFDTLTHTQGIYLKKCCVIGT